MNKCDRFQFVFDFLSYLFNLNIIKNHFGQMTASIVFGCAFCLCKCTCRMYKGELYVKRRMATAVAKQHVNWSLLCYLFLCPMHRTLYMRLYNSIIKGFLLLHAFINSKQFRGKQILYSNVKQTAILLWFVCNDAIWYVPCTVMPEWGNQTTRNRHGILVNVNFFGAHMKCSSR